MRKGNAASTDTLLSYFGKWSFASLSTRRRINSQDKYVFRRLLKGFASVKNDIWTLKEEWKQWVVCYQNVCPTNHSQALLLHDLLKNTILTEIIGIEGVDDLTAHQLGVESLLAGGEHHLLLHAAVIGSPNGSLRTSSLPGDQQEIGVLSSLLVSVLEIVHNETRLIGGKGIHHLLQVSSLGPYLSIARSFATSLSFTIISTPSTFSMLKMMYLQYWRNLSLSYSRVHSSVHIIPDYGMRTCTIGSNHGEFTAVGFKRLCHDMSARSV